MQKESASPFKFIRKRACLSFVLLTLACGIPNHCPAQFDFDQEPILYQRSQANDAVAVLKEKLKSGEVKLEWDKKLGWLPDLLKHLEIPTSSQTLVFSKTSLQVRHINPRNPRAIFFNDDIYVGYVPGGDLIEISGVDDKLGAVFYTIDQDPGEAEQVPKLIRDENRCMTCHGTSKTMNVPGFLVRSVYPSGSGHPHYGMGTTTTNPTTPFKNRFGGWYVTGQHGSMIHRGNLIARNDQRDPFDYELGSNLDTVPDKVDLERYPARTSDIVALMILEHQSQMHNAITQANYETRKALHHQSVMNQALDRPKDFQSESTKRRIKSAGDKLLQNLLFSEEFELKAPVKGNSNFTSLFEKQGLRDRKKRSLRDFDLQKRMFKYPCSYLIYSSSFDALPAPILDYVEKNLIAILEGNDESGKFDHLTESDRKAILEILLETKPRFKKRFSQLSK